MSRPFATPPEPPLALKVVACVSLAVGAFWVVMGAFATIMPLSVEGPVLGPCMIVIVLPLMYLQFYSVFRAKAGYSAEMAFVYFFSSALFTFGWVTEIGEYILDKGLVNPDWGLLFLVTGICLGVAAYTFVAGVLSYRWYRQLKCWIDPDRPECATCGYNLTGNMSGVCPECGGKVISDREALELQHLRKRFSHLVDSLKDAPARIRADDPCFCRSGVTFKECHGKPFDYEAEASQALNDLVDDERCVEETIQRVAKHISETIDDPLWQRVARDVAVGFFETEADLRTDSRWKPTPFADLVDEALRSIDEFSRGLGAENHTHQRETRCCKCGYNLTGNVSGVCPECGERI